LTSLRCIGLTCHRPEWAQGPARVESLSAAFAEATLTRVAGPPGSGKTLLLHLLGLLEMPDSGSIEIFGQNATAAPEDARIGIRNAVFGFLFAAPCLLPAFTVAENVAIPLFRISNCDPGAARQRVTETLALLGIEHLAGASPGDLRLADQRLAALARALIHRPRILLLISPDEPESLLPFVREIVCGLGITCLWSDGAGALKGRCDHEILLAAGRLAAERISQP
jgi:ABC-type lipoprotein export system ATPase subunit